MREDIRQYLEDHAATYRGVFEGVEDCADLTDALRTSYATVQDYAASRVYPKRAAEFDRWLATHDAEVAANARAEAWADARIFAATRYSLFDSESAFVRFVTAIDDRIEREAADRKSSHEGGA